MNWLYTYRYLLLYLLVILLAATLRLYKLDSIPNGLEQDETSIGYNAYAIAKTGADEYGKRYPLYFQAFGEYKLPGYIYASVPFIHFLGMTPTSVRLVAALSGVGTVALVYPLTLWCVRYERQKRLTALMSTLLLAITPWHLHFSRGAFEVSLALFFLTGGSVAFLLSLRRRSITALMLSTLCFILSMYTYNLTRLLSPLLFFSLLIITQFTLFSRFTRKQLVSVGIIGALCLLPFVVTFFSAGGAHNTQSTLIFTSAVTQGKLLEFRSYFPLNSVVTKLLFNQKILTTWQYVENVASYFSVHFFFLQGSTHGNHGIGTEGQFYLFELPFLLIGSAFLFFRYSTHKTLLLFFPLWIALTVLLASLTREAPQATRSFFLVVPLTMVVALGIVASIRLLRRLPLLPLKVLSVLLCIGVGYSVLHYLGSYYVRFPKAYAKQWNAADPTVMQYIGGPLGQSYDEIVIDTRTHIPYTSLLFYLSLDPATVSTQAQRTTPDSEGFLYIAKLGKYRIEELNWTKEKEQKTKRTLYITTQAHTKSEPTAQIVDTFYYPEIPIVNVLGAQLLRVLEKPVAYVAVTLP